MKKTVVFLVILSMLSCCFSFSAYGDNEFVNITLGPPIISSITEEEAAEMFDGMGIDTYTLNADGTVSFSATKDKMAEIKKETMDEVEEMFQETVENSGGTIERIEHNDSLTSISVYVKDDWIISFAAPIYTYAFAIYSTMYQELNGVSQENLTLEVSYFDAETNEIILSQSTDEIFTDEFFSSQDFFSEESEQAEQMEPVVSENMVVEGAGYKIQIVGVHPYVGSDDEMYGAIECIFTNDNAQGISVSDVVSFVAYQNNVQCYKSNLYLSNDYDWDTEYTRVKKGASITAFSAIPLFNDTDPIELEVTLRDEQWNKVASAAFIIDLG